MKRINFELHIDDSNLAKVKTIHTIIEVVESLGSDTYAVMKIIDNKRHVLVECQHHLPAAAPFLRVYCDPMQKNAILELLKEKMLHMDTEIVALLAFEAATDMIPEGSFNDDDITPNDREHDG